MIVAAALPLVAEFGTAVTTSQIARAAGIGEGTIFRAFADKDEVLHACVAEAVSPDHVIRELASISLDQPLAARLTEAAETMRAHLERMGTVIGALHASGHRRGHTPGSHGETPPEGGRETSIRAIRDAVTELIEPDQAVLRLDQKKVASLFLGMLFTQLHRPVDGSEPELTPEELVDALLYGALRTAGGAR